MSELHWLSAAEAARAIAARELSPVELMRALLDRIERLDPKLNVFIRLDGDAAMAAARAAEAEIACGRPRGKLHGVPVGIKDIIDVAGLPTTCHSKILIDNIASADAVCVARLRGAGAIVLGKLSTHEFAIGGPSFDLPWPPARNPWNPDASSRRLLVRLGSRGRGRAVPDGARQRYRRQRAQSGQRLRYCRVEADLWSGVAPRRLSAVVHARPCRAADPHRAPTTR